MKPEEEHTLEALLWDAFEGEPGSGSRELRLRPEEAARLSGLWPEGRLEAMEAPGGAAAQWYRLTFPAPGAECAPPDARGKEADS